MNSLQFNRHRRLRQSGSMRALVRETFLHTEDFIYPIFVLEGENVRNEVPSMPGVYQMSLDLLQAEMQEVVDLGIRSVIVFGLPAE
ncbi:porphobilinogen synthase, partial [Bacillus sp. ZZQ-131]